MSAAALETFLARIYVDPSARSRFKADPLTEAAQAGLTAEECAALLKIDWSDLEITASSFASKRRAKTKAQNRPSHLLRAAHAFRRFLRSLA